MSGSDFSLLGKMDLVELLFLPNIWHVCEFTPNSLISANALLSTGQAEIFQW